MAKLSGFQCDRCGKHYDKNHAKDVWGRWTQQIVGCAIVNVSGQLLRFDLCDECLAELQSWLDDDEK